MSPTSISLGPHYGELTETEVVIEWEVGPWTRGF
jgi:hypothetical protein